MQTEHVAGLDTDEAEATLGTYFPGITLESAPTAVPFRLDLGVWTGSGLSYLAYELGGRPLDVSVPDTDGTMVGRAEVRGSLWDGDREIDSRRPFRIPPGLLGHYEFARAEMVLIADSVTERHLSARAGRPASGRFRAVGTAPKSAEHDHRWATVMTMVGSAMREGIVDEPTVGAALADLVVTSYLSCFPHNWNDHDDRMTATTATVRRAVAYIDEHATEPLTSADIADAARMSVRGIEHAFRTQLETTPTEYLRRVRLELARAELIAADPTTGATVAAAALAAGFRHSSRFTAAYRDAFGESPSDTLRR